MERAVILIGVGRARDLHELPAVGDGIKAMEQWANSQGLPADRVTTITDLDGEPVTLSAVTAAVNKYVGSKVVEQLIIHFCGHGMVVDMNEVWLLSDAMEFGHEAVSVAKSTFAATSGVIPHVVMVSDACRTAPETIADAASVGSSIFPTKRHGNRCFVDVFYATRRGEPALQVSSTDVRTDAAPVYHPVYTEVFAEALQGDYEDVVEEVDDELGPARLVRVGPLYKALPDLVYDRLESLKTTASQTPDGDICYDTGQNWVSRIPPVGPGLEGRRGRSPRAPDTGRAPDHLAELAGEAASRLMQLPAPPPIVGVHVVGAEIEVADAGPAPVSVNGQDIVVEVGSSPLWPLLLGLHRGGLVVVPVFGNRVVSVVVEDGQLVDVVYAASDRPVPPSEERAWLGAASRWVLPWWDVTSPEDIVQGYADLTDRDPAAGVLVAHALVELGRPDLVEALVRPAMLPDVALLAGVAGANKGVFPPMFSRTWPFLGEHGLAPLPETPPRLTSPWTMFASDGLDALHDRLFDPRRQP